MAVRGRGFTGRHNSAGTREQLQGQPKFVCVCGPMWEGFGEDGYAVIRYEDGAAYDSLSN